MKMRTLSNLIGIVCTATLLTAVLSGCSGSSGQNSAASVQPGGGAASDKPVTIRFGWWGSDARHKATLDVIKLYEQRNPNVKIEAEYMGSDGYLDKLKTQLAGGTAPDIMQLDAPWMSDFGRMGDFFADLGKFQKDLDTKGFDAKFLKDYGMQKGKLVALPTGINATTMIFNKTVLDKAGINPDQEWTFDSLISEGKKVNQADPNEYFLNLDQYLIAEDLLRGYIVQKTGQQFIKDDDTLGFTKADLVDALNYEKKLFDEKVLQPADGSFAFKNKQDQNPKWANNQFGGTIDFSSVITSKTGSFKDNVAVARFPMLPGAKDIGLPVRPAQLLAINAKSDPKVQEESAKFLNFFFNDKDAILILKDVRSIQPTDAGRKICLDAKVVDPNVSKAVDLAVAKAGAQQNAPSQYQPLSDIFVDTVEKVGFNKMTPEQAADDMIKQYEAKLKELKASSK